ncbi:tight junction protein ZO-3-like isoform X2 [Watersipora subatra]|uniref:tight junction protein ZO-3-like isoform X2 n=1 Tax=Watersipora subatra TaxID=2589382 RepID=UPI00355BDA80
MDVGVVPPEDVTFAATAQSDNQSLQLTLELALKERDSSLRENSKLNEEKHSLLDKLEQLRVERDRAIESLNGELAERTNDQEQENTNRDMLDIPEKLGLIESEIIDTGTDKVIWETHRVTLERIPGFGFGIAVAGGKDNPHFSNGDPSIAISDVLKAGPAENKLQINDRVLSVNGVSFETVEHSEAIRLLKESGNQVELVVKRKLLVPNPQEFQPTKVVLQKRHKRDDYGIILGCKFYVKEVLPNSLAAFDGAVKEGDTILRINNIGVESISLQDAKRQLDKSKEKLQLTLKKPPRAPSVTNLLHKRQNSDLDYMTKFQPFKTDNMYLSSAAHEKGDYDKPSINSYVRSTATEQLLSPYRTPEQTGHYKRPDQAVIQLPIVNGYAPEMPAQSPAPVYYDSSRLFGGETRYISYNKEGGEAGLRIAGGNHTGIYIASVQDGSPAQREGLREGDEIIEIDNVPTRGMTREETVQKIMESEDRIYLVVQNRIVEYRRVLVFTNTDSGDLFHIRVHMSYEAPKGSNHLSFQPGDIFKVTDTLRSGTRGEWNVVKLDAQNEELARGVIPNSVRAENLRRPKDEKEKSGKGSIFRRKNQKRSKSLGRDHWEDVIFAKETSKYEAYERVVLLEPGFMRPVVIYGGLADIAQERLLREVPEHFESPPTPENQEDEVSKTGIVKLGSIRTVIDLGKHCVLDVVPSAIDKLNYAQFYPIVVNLKSDRKDVVKDLRAKYSSASAKNSRKLYEQGVKVEKSYPQIFTKEIELHPQADWFTELREVVAKEQVKALWISEYKPTENMADDFLFPMANRLSYIGSAENEMEMSRMADQPYNCGTLDKTMARSSSDPHLASPDAEMPLTPGYTTQQSMPAPVSNISGGAAAPYASRAEYAAAMQRVPRDRMLSDSRVHYHSSPFNGYNSIDRREHSGSIGGARGHPSNTGPKQESDNSNLIGARQVDRHSHYMSPRNGKSTHDPYKFTRMTSQPGFSKPAPPVRTDSMGSGTHSENPYGHSRLVKQKRVNHSMSLDTGQADEEIHIRNYENSPRPAQDTPNPYTAAGRVRRPSGPTATSHYLHPQSPAAVGSPNIFFPSTPSSRSRNNGHYAQGLMSQSLPADDSVFHATPVSIHANSSYTNQLYMESKEASGIAPSSQPATQPVDPSKSSSGSFENYKKFVSNTPFYGARKEGKKSRKKSTGSDGETGSAFETYKKADPPFSTELDMEPTPDNHIVLDTVSGVIDSAGGVLSSESTGVSLYFPHNAIPNGVRQEVYFKVSKQDDSLVSALDKDAGEQLVSPLVVCGPQGLKFQLPVELRLPCPAAPESNNVMFKLKSSNDGAAEAADNGWQSQNLNNIPPSPGVNGQQNPFSIFVDHF